MIAFIIAIARKYSIKMIREIMIRAVRVLAIISYLLAVGTFLLAGYNVGYDLFLIGFLALALIAIDFLKVALIYIILGKLLYNEAWFLLIMLALIASIVESISDTKKSVSIRIKEIRSLTWSQAIRKLWKPFKFAIILGTIAVGIPAIGILILFLLAKLGIIQL